MQSSVSVNDPIRMLTICFSDTGNDEIALEQLLNVLHFIAIHHLVADFDGESIHCHRLQIAAPALRISLFRFGVYPEYITQKDERKNHAKYTHRVSNGIPCGYLRCIDVAQVAECLLGGPESRCICHRTR